MIKLIEWFKPFKCGDGIEYFDAPTCQQKFWSVASAMVHYIKIHRGPCKCIWAVK